VGKFSKKILTIFGTRPEIIKLAPVIKQLEACGRSLQTLNVTSAQHTDLLYPFVRLFGIRIDQDLQIMEPNQTPNNVCSRVLASLDPILAQERPDMILVQGDTTTAMSGALAGFHRQIPIAHVEAGLRTGDAYSPYPEEMNRRIITRLAAYHFAATSRNRDTLLSEGVPHESIFVTGNPVIDSLKTILERSATTPVLEEVLEATEGLRRIIVTTHRRESFGEVMAENLRVLRHFIDQYEDIGLIFPVHPNPAVLGPATSILAGHPRIHLIQPLSYEYFIVLLSHAWLIVSDSGGIQEEAPTLGKPLLVLRKNTERPEAVESGVARLVGDSPKRLGAMLEEVRQDGNWADEIRKVGNPFGQGDSAKRIAQLIAKLLKEAPYHHYHSGN
jgi:UDP-N-acetylglucosamine 2-epimerase (non-hydrolysing)